MDQESEKKTEKTAAGDEIKKANIASEEIPCVDMTSDTETDVDQSKDSKSVEINGCENSGKSSGKTSNSSLEDANEDTSEELDVSSSDKVTEPSSPVPAAKTTETKNNVKNDISGKSSPDAENMDSETNDGSKSEPKSGDEKLKSDDSEKISDSKTNRAVKKRRSSADDSEPMDVDELPKSSKKDETSKRSELPKSRRERKKSENESSSEVTSQKEKSQKVKSEDTSKEKKSEQRSEIKIKIKGEIPENHVEEKVNEEVNHEDKKPENSVEVKKEKYTEESKKEEKKHEDNEESKEKSKTNSSKTPLSNSTESKPKSEGSEKKKSKKNRTCEECGTTKGLKFQVVFQGKPRFLCSEVCCKSFKAKQKLAKSAPPAPPPPVSEQKPAVETDSCAYCKKEIKGSKGYYPVVGEVKPLCTEECLLNYQESNAPKKKCSQCKVEIEDEFSCLSWETMEFCNEDCLGKYQSFLGSHCTCCQSPVQQTSLGKYCVCFGADIRQFCSGTCLEEFKKGLKVCSFCQKDLSSGLEGFLAPVGEKGMFKEFCTQQCMERYETMNNNSNPPQNQHCSFCRKSGIYKIQTKHGDKSAVLCSENCVAGYRYINKIFQKMCDTCYKFFDPEKDSEFLLQFEGVNKFYCSKPCMTLFVLSHRKIVPCTWCKVKKYNFDMIEKLDSSNQTQTYCSLNCISLYRVSVNATSAKSIRCDNCTKNLPAQYHLTMSDGSIRNFCTYPCVIHFQNQFTNVPTLTTTTPSNRQNATTLSTIAAKTTSSGSTTPVISNVMSLAATSPRSPVPNLSAKLVPQKLVAAPARQASPSLAIITTKAASPLQTVSTPTAATASTGSGMSQVVKEVIVKPPPPKSMKNKSVLCKPIMQTKGVSCKPHPCHKAVQTDESTLPSIIPIPVPIYVPTPVHMFSRPVPCPVPFPIPIPVPIFIPTTKDSPTQIMKHLKDIQDKIPSNPFEAELLMMAEMVAENDEEKGQTSEDLYPSENFDGTPDIPALDSMAINETALDVETALPSGIAPVIQKEQDTVSDTVEDYFLKDGRGHGQGKRSATSHGRGRGRAKRTRLEGPPPEELDPFAAMPLLEDQNSAHHSEPPDSAARLKYTFGVNAWKHWVLQKNSQLEKGSQSSRKFKLFKTDLLQLPPDELNYSLCLFVKEVRKPNGEEYAPASIYYLCLGIQQYLFENGRIDNIFTDPYYEKFTECLNDVLQNQEEIMTSEGYFVSRIEEEVLWESKQLGAHSPHVLLNTLMYFNTKYFNLKSIDDHTHLSFSHITKHWRKTSVKAGPRSVILRYYPPSNKDWQNRRRKEEPTMYEQNENVENPLRCPVKLYEFYLSKCPESVKTRNDVFYLYPERSCVPDSPVWYSTQALGREMISKMLQRIKTVREIYET